MVLNFLENSSHIAITTPNKFSKYENQGTWMLLKLILYLTVMTQVLPGRQTNEKIFNGVI